MANGGTSDASAVIFPLLILGFAVVSMLPGWVTAVLVLGGLVFGAGHVASFVEKAEKAQRQAKTEHAPQAEVGEIVEICFTGDGGEFRVVAMRARWGTWPQEAVEALTGEAYLLPARALADPTMRDERTKASGRIVVVKREELRAIGVRSWLSVAEAVGAIGAKGLLIINIDEELVPLALPAGSRTRQGLGINALLPSAMLRNAEGAPLLRVLARGMVQLRGLGVVEVSRARAEELIASQRYADAAHALAEGLQKAEGKTIVEMRVLRSDALRLANQPEEALADARTAVDLDPESADGWVAVVRAYLAADQREEATKAAEQAVELYELRDSRLETLVSELSRSPEEVASEYKEKGNVLFKEHRFPEARTAYTAAIAAIPVGRAPELICACLGNRAACAQQLHDWDSVIVDATQALDFQPNNAKVRLRRAAAYEATEKFKDALVDARLVLRIEASHPQANAIQHRAGRALRELGIPDPGRNNSSDDRGTSSSVPQEQRAESNARSCEAGLEQEVVENVGVAREYPSLAPAEPELGSTIGNDADRSIEILPSNPCPDAASMSQPREHGDPVVDATCTSHPNENVGADQIGLQADIVDDLRSEGERRRVQELEEALSCSETSRLALEQRCASLERQLDALRNTNNGAVSSSALVSPSPPSRVAELSSPAKIASTSAARRAQQLETFVALLHTKSRSSGEHPSNSFSPMPETTSICSCRSPSPTTAPHQQLLSSGGSSVSLVEECNSLQRELRKSRRDRQQLQKTMKGFYNRFQVRLG